MTTTYDAMICQSCTGGASQGDPLVPAARCDGLPPRDDFRVHRSHTTDPESDWFGLDGSNGMTTTSSAAGREHTGSSRCASILSQAGDVVSVIGSGALALFAAGVLIGFHVVGTSIAGRLIAASVALALFCADRGISPLWPVARWLPVRWDPRLSGARERYFLLDDQAGRLMRKLGREDDPARRAELLDGLAAAKQAMADVHMEAFGPDPIKWEDDRDLAESIALSAILIRVLAQCEHALAGAPLTTDYPAEFADAERIPLSLLAASRDRTRRADLINELYDACVGRVGGQAAEVLDTLARAERLTAKRHA